MFHTMNTINFLIATSQLILLHLALIGLLLYLQRKCVQQQLMPPELPRVLDTSNLQTPKCRNRLCPLCYGMSPGSSAALRQFVLVPFHSINRPEVEKYTGLNIQHQTTINTFCLVYKKIPTYTKTVEHT